jgi:DeoR/GlpR family transcriptional regulator of sugar metabolism
MNDRQKNILKTVTKYRDTTVNELARKFNISAVTIRQDLNLLENEGFLKRRHGGVSFIDTDDISSRLAINYENKLKIVEKASGFVFPGETILIESGSTNALLAKEISKKEGITVVTPNLFIAREFGKSEKNRVVLLGGEYQPESESLIGSLTKLCLDHVFFQKAFIGVDGFTQQTGFTSRDMMRAEISAEIIQKSEQVFILTDSSKFGRVGLTILTGPDEVDSVVTDKGIPEKDKDYLEEKGVTVIIS